MHTINILKNTPLEAVLALIEDEILKYQTKYILLSFSKDYQYLDRKTTVERIKKYFDIFIILKTEIPNDKYRIEEYFSYGVHGIFFINNNDLHTKMDLEIITYATELFTPGWVFANSKNNKILVEELLSLKIIPVVYNEDEKVIDFIKSHNNFSKISSGLVKFIPLLDRNQTEYSLVDKVKMKMVLESLNLRQKLMIKSIDDSFTSSGL